VKQGTGANVTTKEFNPPVWVLTQGTSSEEPELTYTLVGETRYRSKCDY